MIRIISYALFFLFFSNAHAQNLLNLQELTYEKNIEDVLITAQLQLELSSVVEETLSKGLPVYFKADAYLYKERWYWYDKLISSTTRNYKLAYQPLTGKWRVGINIDASGVQQSTPSLLLNQLFDTLPMALASVNRISKWRIASTQDLDASARYRIDFRFQLDVSQLPRPFQIGILGHTDWDMNVTRSMHISQEIVK